MKNRSPWQGWLFNSVAKCLKTHSSKCKIYLLEGINGSRTKLEKLLSYLEKHIACRPGWKGAEVVRHSEFICSKVINTTVHSKAGFFWCTSGGPIKPITRSSHATQKQSKAHGMLFLFVLSSFILWASLRVVLGCQYWLWKNANHWR